jgi:hypothetical protein
MRLEAEAKWRESTVQSRLGQFEFRGIDDRPKMDRPSKEYEPQGESENELNDRHRETALKELPESGNEEAA